MQAVGKRGLRIMYLRPPRLIKKLSVKWKEKMSHGKNKIYSAWNLFSVREGDEFHEASKSVSLKFCKAKSIQGSRHSGEILDILFSGSVFEAVTGDAIIRPPLQSV